MQNAEVVNLLAADNDIMERSLAKQMISRIMSVGHSKILLLIYSAKIVTISHHL